MKLKPCPFCGSEDSYVHVDSQSATTYFYVICRNCLCRGPYVHIIYGHDTSAEVEWNTRVIGRESDT